MSSVFEQITALERERSRLEGCLAGDENWLALMSIQALNGAAPADAGETEQRLRRLLAGNPYYAARLKIIEAVTILRRLGDVEHARPQQAGQQLAPRTKTPRGTVESLGLPLGVPLFGEMETPPRKMEVFGSTNATDHASTEPPPVAAHNANSGSSDFTRIRTITPDMAATLNKLGTHTFAQMAAWTAADVARISSALGLGRTISKQNWIEHAALLAAKESKQAAPSEPAVMTTEPPGAASTAAAAATTIVALELNEQLADAPPTAALPLDGAEQPASADEPRTKTVPAPQALPIAVVPEDNIAAAQEEPVDRPQPETLSPRDWLNKRRLASAGTRASLTISTPIAGLAMPPPLPASMPTAQPGPLPSPTRSDWGQGTVPRAYIFENESEASEPPADGLLFGRAVLTEAEVNITEVSSAVASLRSRLRVRSPKPGEVDPATHAAYQERIEEADVRIVRNNNTTGSIHLPSRPAAPGMISRFLIALKGRD